MIYSQKVKVKIVPSNINYYRKIGYTNIRFNDEIEVGVFELPAPAKKIVKCRCDFCGKDFERGYFLVSNRKKHTCGDQECKKKLRAETCLECYGVDHINKNKEIKQKGAKCFEKRYGKNSPIHEEFIKRREETCIKRHGTRNGSDPSKSSETRSKAVNTMIANFENAKCKKGTKKVLASQEQVHICELLNGVLNFDFFTRSIDIAFPEEKMAIEYDGGGHAYWNSFHSQDDSQRDSELLENNWKLIHIINSRDNVFPQDSDFLKIIFYSKKILNSASLIYVNFIKHTISYDDTVIKLSDDNVLQGGVVE